jgi:SprT-like family
VTAPEQLTLALEQPEGLETRLRLVGLAPAIEVVLHRNRRTMVTLAQSRLRIHQGYRWAPEEVLRAIVRWTRPRLPAPERRAAVRLLLSFPVHDFVAPPPRPRRRVLEPAEPGDDARLERLEAMHQELNRRWFGGRLARIALRLSGRMRRKLGHYEPADQGEPAIVISRRHFRRDGWRAAADTLLHEMVHQWQDETGRPIDHGPAFREKAMEVGIEPRAVTRRRPIRPLDLAS